MVGYSRRMWSLFTYLKKFSFGGSSSSNVEDRNSLILEKRENEVNVMFVVFPFLHVILVIFEPMTFQFVRQDALINYATDQHCRSQHFRFSYSLSKTYTRRQKTEEEAAGRGGERKKRWTWPLKISKNRKISTQFIFINIRYVYVNI